MHQRQRSQCAECQDFPCTIENCPQFGHRFSSAQAIMKHMSSLHSLEKKAQTKAKELSVISALKAAAIGFEYQKHIPFRACDIETDSTCAFVDFAILARWGVILLEVDEGQHRTYPAVCDPRRDVDMYTSVALGRAHKMVILRYNPDSFRLDDHNRRVSTKDRQRRLIEVLQDWLQKDPAPEQPLRRYFMYYDMQSGSHLPVVAKDWQSKEAREISSVLI